MAHYVIPHVDIQSWLDAGDPVENVNMATSQAIANNMLLGRLVNTLPEHTFELSRAPGDHVLVDDDADNDRINAIYQWVYDNADDWLTIGERS